MTKTELRDFLISAKGVEVFQSGFVVGAVLFTLKAIINDSSTTADEVLELTALAKNIGITRIA